MDLEQRLRESLVAPDPGARFTAAVMTRLGRGRWRWRNRVVLMSTVLGVGIAAAMLALRLSGGPQSPVIVDVPAPQALPAVTTAAPVPAPAGIPLMPPRPAEAKPQVEQPEVFPPAVPEQQTSPHFTVVALLRHEATEPEARAAAQTFFDLLLDELRKVPGLTLRVWEGEPPPPVRDDETGLMIVRPSAPLRDGEYGLTLVSLAGSSAAPRPGVNNSAANQRAWAMELRTQRRELPQPADAPRAARVGRQSLVYAREQDMAQQVRRTAEDLRLQVFPLDSAMRAQLIARMGDSAVAEPERARALGDLLSAANRTGPGASMDATTVAAAARLLADQPASRGMVARALRGHPEPVLVPLLLESLDSGVDEATRQETLITLVADYSGDPTVRAALQVAAGSDGSELLRALAAYPVAGVDAWRSYVRRILDEGASPADKVKPLIFAANQTAGAFQKAAIEAMANDAQVVEAVLVIGRAVRAEPDRQKKLTIQQALYVLTRPEGGPVVAGTPRQEAQELINELSRVQLPARPPQSDQLSSPR